MKKKKIELSKKLNLSKETIAKLNGNQEAAVMGGAATVFPCVVPTVLNCPSVTKCASIIINNCSQNVICQSKYSVCDCS